MAKASKSTFRNIRLNLEELESREMPSANPADVFVGPVNYATDHVLVRWLGDAPAAPDFAAGTESLGNNTYSIQLKSGESVTAALKWYRAQSGIDYAQTDGLIQVAATTNDTYASQQWALSNINASTAWNYTTGSKQIIVAVVDTGVDYTHSDLSANIWKNTGEIAGNGKDDDGNGYVDDVYGYNFSGSNGNPLDDNGHGSHVAGIIGAVGNNANGTAGVNWNVSIMSLKFMDSTGSGYTSNAVKAIYYAVNNGAKIINDSWGGGTYDAALASAIQYAQAHGVIVVNAAGNSSTNIDSTPFYPASNHYSNVINVAATDQNNNLASFSNYGASSVDIAAPGVSIISTYSSGRYAYMSGTSMAAPFVTGAAALIWSENPTWTYSQVINDLLSNTTTSASLAGKVRTGVLNVGLAAQAGSHSPSQPPTLTANPANQSVAAGGAVAFTASASGYTSVQWQASTDGGSNWSNLSNGGYYSGVNTTSLTVSGAVTSMNGFKYRAVFTNAANQSTTTASAQLSVTSSHAYSAYINSYYSYVYAYYAYVTGGGAYAQAAMNNAYASFYYAYYAYYYGSIGNTSAATYFASYSQYYSYVASYYSSYTYATTGNAYSYYANNYCCIAYTDSYYVRAGY